MLNFEIDSPDPSRTHPERKIMETNYFKSHFRNLIRGSLGQLQLFSKAHSNEFRIACQICETLFS